MNISFITIPTSSLDDSIEFYTKVLGFTERNRVKPREGIEIAFLSDEKGSVIELIQRPGDVDLSACPVSLGFEVEDIHAVRDLLSENGVEILMGPTEAGGGTILMQAKDVNGFRLGFVQSG
jgi:predicted enzyme related to lactoylglutathione lyase